VSQALEVEGVTRRVAERGDQQNGAEIKDGIETTLNREKAEKEMRDSDVRG
jgi:hypothetical protein